MADELFGVEGWEELEETIDVLGDLSIPAVK
jgi:hypothetical protein